MVRFKGKLGEKKKISQDTFGGLRHRLWESFVPEVLYGRVGFPRGVQNTTEKCKIRQLLRPASNEW